MKLHDLSRAGALASGTLLVALSVWAGGWMAPPGEPSPAASASAQHLDEAALWLAPPLPSAPPDLARGVALLAEDKAAEALPLFSRRLSDPEIGVYARLYVGRAQLALGRHADAASSARQVIETSPAGHLGESALWLLAEAHEGAGEGPQALAAWQALAGLPLANPGAAHLRLAQAAEEVGDTSAARGAYARIHFEWPTSVEARDASAGLSRHGLPEGFDLSRLERSRAEKLYAGRRYADAREAFEGLRKEASGDDRLLFDLRIAQCDVYLRRYGQARDRLDAYLKQTKVGLAEASAFRLTALRGLQQTDAYVRGVSAHVAAHPDSPYAESALNDLATYYILSDDDASAARVFTDMYARFPSGVYADRAAWRAGWWAYRAGQYRETIRLFESAAVGMPRADYRPSWLYWAARAHQQLGARDQALAGYRRTIADYRNSYYGREAAQAIAAIPGGVAAAAQISVQLDPARAITGGRSPANAPLVRNLLAAGLYDDAIFELRRAQAEAGTSSIIEATIAYALHRKGELRPAITAMRRAYPGFMAEGGELLPRRIMRVIFPIAHWDLIRRYATERGIDPWLMTALVAQESTFQADVRSSANAWGLMQLLPSTAQRYATKVGLRGFSTARLTDPEVNVRLGSAYLSDLLVRFDDPAPALAAYNAGENRVTRWRAERPGVPRDEFIDDIPFPETQNYVKRILGTSEDYRILYAASHGEGVRESRR